MGADIGLSSALFTGQVHSGGFPADVAGPTKGATYSAEAAGTAPALRLPTPKHLAPPTNLHRSRQAQRDEPDQLRDDARDPEQPGEHEDSPCDEGDVLTGDGQ